MWVCLLILTLVAPSVSAEEAIIVDHDCGYYPNRVNETREYLDDPSHADVNGIINRL
jgi:hypothetical protein